MQSMWTSEAAARLTAGKLPAQRLENNDLRIAEIGGGILLEGIRRLFWEYYVKMI